MSLWKRAFRKRPGYIHLTSYLSEIHTYCAAPQILPEAIVAAHDLISGMYIPGDSTVLINPFFLFSRSWSRLWYGSRVPREGVCSSHIWKASGTQLASSYPTTPSNDSPKMPQKISTE
ncbi:hypothetical protein FRC12_012086 [Ceratobasidium sp. 428]|nr:hypothetical protein FRC12_012086 [Ceratobasidium sp. 428]